MEGREKPHMEKYKEITNYWNYDASCMFTSLPASDYENFQCLIFVAQSAQTALALREDLIFEHNSFYLATDNFVFLNRYRVT
jgi:hypothetical protein